MPRTTPKPNTPDRQWLDLCADRFDPEVRAYLEHVIIRPLLFNRRLGNSQVRLHLHLGYTAEDIVADLFLHAIAVLDPTRTVNAPKAYLRRALLNRLRTLHVRANSRPALVSDHAQDENGEPVDEAEALTVGGNTGQRRNGKPMLAGAASTVRLDLSCLSAREKEVAAGLMLGDRQADIARDLGISRAAVSKAVSRIRTKLTNGMTRRSITSRQVPNRGGHTDGQNPEDRAHAEGPHAPTV